MQTKIINYLSNYPNSQLFYNTYIGPSMTKYNINTDSIEGQIINDELYIRVNGVNILIFMKDNSVQLLPHSKLLKLKCNYIADHYKTFDVHTFLKSKHNNKYYISVIYKKMAGHENALHTLADKTMHCVKSVFMTPTV